MKSCGSLSHCSFGLGGELMRGDKIHSTCARPVCQSSDLFIILRLMAL